MLVLEVLRTLTCQVVIWPLFCVSLSSPSSVKSSVHLLRRFRCGEDPEQSKLRAGLDSAIVREKPNIKWTDVAAVLHRWVVSVVEMKRDLLYGVFHWFGWWIYLGFVCFVGKRRPWRAMVSCLALLLSFVISMCRLASMPKTLRWTIESDLIDLAVVCRRYWLMYSVCFCVLEQGKWF